MNVFDLVAKISLDSSEYDKGLNDSESKLSSFGGKIASGFGTVAKVAAGAVAAGSVAVGKLVSDSLSAYAAYEQNVGGVKKLYGNMGQTLEEYAQTTGKTVEEVGEEWSRLENAQKTVLENARNAYKTSGMDMNTYMETATSFSAALINSLGGDTRLAADQTDKAMRAISDNWNTFGGDISMIQGAFQGFAKQNYTMLDNLKLGYGGTKSEMERLIDDANKYAESIGEASDLSIDSFSDIVTAIDLVQQKQNIAGTTQREAASTISGSLGMLKAAWTNLVIGMTDSEADIDSLLDNVVESAEIAFSNILPAAERALGGIANLIEKVAPLVAEKLPELVEQLVPPLVSSAASLIAGIIEALPALIQVLIEQIPVVATILWNAIIETLPMFLEAGQNLMQGMGDGIDLNIPDIINRVTMMLVNMINTIFAYLPQFLQKGMDFVSNLASGIGNNLPAIITAIGNILTALVNNIFTYMPIFLQKGADFIVNMVSGISNKMPEITNKIGTVLSELIRIIMQKLPDFLDKGIEIISNMISGIARQLPEIIQSLASLLAKLIYTIAQNLPDFLQKGVEIIGKLLAGLIQAIPDIISAIPGILSDIAGEFMNFDWLSVGSNIIYGIADGVSNAAGWLINSALNVVASAWNSMLGWLGIHSPSKKAEKVIGKNWAEGIGLGFERNMPVDEMVGAVEDAFNEVNDIEPEFSPTYTSNGSGNRGSTFAPVLNIYGAEGQDMNELADIIMERMAFLYNQEGAAYGMA